MGQNSFHRNLSTTIYKWKKLSNAEILNRALNFKGSYDDVQIVLSIIDDLIGKGKFRMTGMEICPTMLNRKGSDRWYTYGASSYTPRCTWGIRLKPTNLKIVRKVQVSPIKLVVA